MLAGRSCAPSPLFDVTLIEKHLVKKQILGIRRIEKALPECLGVAQIQWVVWAYAVFQLLRRNNLFLALISSVVYYIKAFTVDLFCYLFYGRDLVEVRLIAYALRLEERYLETEEDGDEYFQRNPPKTFAVVPSDESWPLEWRVVEFNGWQYITTKSALDTMATWICRHCHGDDKNVLFLHKVGFGLVDERISREEAYEKIFSGSYLVGVYDGGFPSTTSFSEMNGKLSTIPVLLQAWNYNRTSTLFAFVIILLDFFHYVINNIYHCLYLNIRVSVKSKLNMKRINGNTCLSFAAGLMAALLGWRWIPTDYLDCEYVAEEGREIRVYPQCKVKSVDDVMRILGSGYYTASEEAHPEEDQIHIYDPNDKPMLMLWGKRAVLVWNLSHPPKVQFGIATLEKGIVVEHSL